MSYDIEYVNLATYPVNLSTQIFLNGVGVIPSYSLTTNGAGVGTAVTNSRTCSIELSTGDQLTLYVNNETDVTALRVHGFNLSITKLQDVTVISPPEKAYGEVDFPSENLTQTVINFVNVPVKIAGVTVPHPNNRLFDTPSSDDLRYTGSGTIFVHCGCSVSFRASSNVATDWEIFGRVLQVDMNYREIPSSIAHRTTKSGEIGSSAIHFFTELSTGESVEVWCQNDTNTQNLTFAHLNLFAMSMDRIV